MAFEGLTQRLAGTFKKLKNRGKLSEADVKEATAWPRSLWRM